jgi:putative membrane protein
MKQAIYAGLVVLWPVVVIAQTRVPEPSTAHTSQTARANMQASDATFVRRAAESGLAEVQMGQLAEEKAQDPKVKEFGQRMVTDHTAANQQLMSIATAQGMTPPNELDSKDAATLRKLRGESGSQFDRNYIQGQVAAHREAISLFEREGKQSRDTALRQFAEKTLPTLQEHLRMAEGLQKQE